MGWVKFIATEGIVPPHEAGEEVTLEIGFTESNLQKKIERTDQYSDGGALEALLHRVERTFSLTFQPVFGSQLRRLREFLDSTDGAEQFEFDPYGDSPAPRLGRRIDKGYTETSFQRRGSEELDAFTVTIEVLEIAR